jgi:hypothetical protein
MITIESVSRLYGPFTAVDDVSFTAHPGRVTGFLGPMAQGSPPPCGSSSDSPSPPREPPPWPAAGTSTCPTRAARSGCSSTRPPSTPVAPDGRS